MELSNRLKIISEKVISSELFVDIGTDHAYLPIYLLQKGIIKRAVAGDVSKDSIKKARVNINNYGYSEFIETRIGNGLCIINSNENPDTVVMSGMGGMLIIDILKNSADIVQNLKRLIVQPQRDIDKVRKYIHKINFKIIDEKMIIEDNKYYNIITCIYGEDYKYSDGEYLFGKLLIDEKNNVLKEYIKHEMYKIDRAILSIKQSNKTNSNRLNQLKTLEYNCKEALRCLQNV